MNLSNMEIRYHLLDRGLDPYIARGSAGYDLSIIESITFPVGKTTIVDYKVCFEMPPSIFAKLETRSSMAILGLTHLGGCIDSDYRGSIIGIVHNLSKEDIHLEYGSRLGQIIFIPIAKPHLAPAIMLKSTLRNFYGFGSTGLLNPGLNKTLSVPLSCEQNAECSTETETETETVQTLGSHKKT